MRFLGGNSKKRVTDARGYKDEGDRMSALLLKRDKARAVLDAAIKKRDRNKK